VLLPQTPDGVDRRRSAGELLAELRGTRGLRPHIDRGLAGGLRAWLDDGIYERLGIVSAGTLRFSTRAFAPAANAPGRSTGLLRGALVTQLVRLHVAAARVTSPMRDAVDALRGSGRDAPLCELIDALDPDERAQLSAEVIAHFEVLCDVLPRVPARWSPRCGVRQAVPLAGGGIVCRGLVDLSLGTPGGTRACVCLLDLTTAPLGANHERVCGYLALLETIRTGEQPLRVAAISTVDGGSIVRDVTPELLAHSVGDLLETIPLAAAA
jgi:hypothetical protein